MYHTRSDYERARKRVKEKKSFYGHLAAYLAASVFFLMVNFLTFNGFFWFFWPMLGWGIGLISHYFSVFGIPGIGRFDDEWEERAIQQELKKTRKIYRQEEDELELREISKNYGKPYRDDEFV